MIISYTRVKVEIKEFLHKAHQEIDDTEKAGVVLKKYAKGHKLTKEERALIKQQVFDILKSVGIGIPFVFVPGASILLPLLIRIGKKHNINFLPSAFK